MKENQAFVRVSHTLSPGNKLQKELLNNLQRFDRCLFESKKEAEKAIEKEYERIAKSYQETGGRAKLPHYGTYIIGKNETGVHIQATMTLVISEVRKWATNQAGGK